MSSRAALLVACAFVLSACAAKQPDDAGKTASAAPASGPKVVCQIDTTTGSRVKVCTTEGNGPDVSTVSQQGVQDAFRGHVGGAPGGK